MPEAHNLVMTIYIPQGSVSKTATGFHLSPLELFENVSLLKNSGSHTVIKNCTSWILARGKAYLTQHKSVKVFSTGCVRVRDPRSCSLDHLSLLQLHSC